MVHFSFSYYSFLFSCIKNCNNILNYISKDLILFKKFFKFYLKVIICFLD